MLQENMSAELLQQIPLHRRHQLDEVQNNLD
jgi:hypothetical protein